jgi:hypothetical protein
VGIAKHLPEREAKLLLLVTFGEALDLGDNDFVAVLPRDVEDGFARNRRSRIEASSPDRIGKGLLRAGMTGKGAVDEVGVNGKRLALRGPLARSARCNPDRSPGHGHPSRPDRRTAPRPRATNVIWMVGHAR